MDPGDHLDPAHTTLCYLAALLLKNSSPVCPGCGLDHLYVSLSSVGSPRSLSDHDSATSPPSYPNMDCSLPGYLRYWIQGSFSRFLVSHGYPYCRLPPARVLPEPEYPPVNTRSTSCSSSSCCLSSRHLKYALSQLNGNLAVALIPTFFLSTYILIKTVSNAMWSTPPW